MKTVINTGDAEEIVASGKVKVKMRSTIDKYGKYFLLLISLIAASIVSNDFLTYLNITNLLSQISIVGILAIAQMLVMLTGGIDLSHGSYIALGSVVIATTMNFGVITSLIIVLICLWILGFLNGTFVNKGIHPFMVTLGMMGIARSLALVISNGKPVIVPADSFDQIAYSMIGPIPLPFIILFILFILFHQFLTHHPTGRQIYAVGGNEEAARLTGVNIKKIKYLVYMLSGILSGFAAIIYTSKVGSGLPDKAVGYELDSIAAAIIGGTSLFGGVGSVTGTMVGVCVYGIISNALNLTGVSPYAQQFIKGLIILCAVYINTRATKK